MEWTKSLLDSLKNELVTMAYLLHAKILSENNLVDKNTFRNRLQEQIVELAKKYHALGERRFVVGYMQDGFTEVGNVDVAWLNDNKMAACFEIEGSLRERTIHRLLGAPTDNKFLLFYGSSFNLQLFKSANHADKIQIVDLTQLMFSRGSKKTPSARLVEVDPDERLTFIEKMLRNALKRSYIHFIEQEPVYEFGPLYSKHPKYVLDLVVFTQGCKIVVECDGTKFHNSPEAKTRDQERDAWLLNNGYHAILRFSGSEIKNDVWQCIKRVKEKIVELTQGVAIVHKDEPRQVSTQQQIEAELEGADDVNDGILVTATCDGYPGSMHYKGVNIGDGTIIFEYGPIEHGSKNIAAFLGITHALALLKKDNAQLQVMSQSKVAVQWIKAKNVRTKLPNDERAAHVWKLIERALTWLNQNSFNKVRFVEKSE